MFTPGKEKSVTQPDVKAPDNKENSGVTQTGLFTNYVKDQARRVGFWEPSRHGKAPRKKDLFKDDYMKLFVTEQIAAQTEKTMDPKLWLALAVRHKFFNKALSAHVKNCSKRIEQVVILGSGYDTRPVRKKKYPVKYFEIDKPEVLANKKRIYDEHKIDTNAKYIGIDYLNENFVKHLIDAGIDLSIPTHFIWEGNTMYLSPDQVKTVLCQIKDAFKGTVYISFDYMGKATIDKIKRVNEVTNMMDKFKSARAPMINGYDNIKALADEAGMILLENHVCSDLTTQYGVGDNPYESQKDYHFCTLGTKK